MPVTHFFEDFVDIDLHEGDVLEQPARLREESNAGGAGLHSLGRMVSGMIR